MTIPKSARTDSQTPPTRLVGFGANAALLYFFAVSYGVSVFGALFRPDEWYGSLAKPAWTPPGWVFGPVWMVLYGTIAIAGWMVWRTQGFKSTGFAFVAYCSQFVFNGLWSWLFFGLHRPGLAFLNISFLWLSIAATALLFYRKNPKAGLLLFPYFMWASFAACLNFSIWRLNV